MQLAVDGDLEEAARLKGFLQKLQIPTTLAQMQVSLSRESLEEVLADIVREPDMEHIPYPVSEDMIYRAMEAVEELQL